jgi:hypothetical protein
MQAAHRYNFYLQESNVADPDPHCFEKLDPDHFGKLDPDPHHFGKLNLDPHQSERQDPDPHQSDKVEALEGHFGALEGPNLEKK